MARVKRGTTSLRKRKKLLKMTKGFMWGRKSKERLAREALLHALPNMYRSRKEKKRNFRKLWQIKIGAAAKENGTSYSRLINDLKKNKIGLDRKILADLAEHQPDIFKQLVTTVLDTKKEQIKTESK
ncbi:MAG: 50S ribosomal protein L20 [bacterium]|nr:50S ribosomal protein L20 [bacterium]